MVQARMVQGWQVWKCFNCCIDVCAIDLNNSVALVNMEMEVFIYFPNIFAFSFSIHI